MLAGGLFILVFFSSSPPIAFPPHAIKDPKSLIPHKFLRSNNHLHIFRHP